jgi:hypothetical protein
MGLDGPPMGDDAAVSLDLRNYELLWPAALFASEGERVLRASNPSWEDQAIWLSLSFMV